MLCQFNSERESKVREKHDKKMNPLSPPIPDCNEAEEQRLEKDRESKPWRHLKDVNYNQPDSSVLNWEFNKCSSSSSSPHTRTSSAMPMSDNDSNSHSLIGINNNNIHNTRNSASIIKKSANCDNYNLMCQLYKSINSREKFPIINQSRGIVGGWWNTFSRRRRSRERPPQMKNIIRWQISLQAAIVLLLAVCPRGVWSWSMQRDPSFYHQPSSDDYYSDVPEKSQIINSFETRKENDFHEVSLPKYGRSPKLIEGTVGQTVILSCIVHNLGSKRVAWMRMRDLQILTHGPLLFTSDVRMSSERPYGDHTRWGLVIMDLRAEDTGKYVCSVNADPEMKQEVELVVREQQQSDMPFVPAGRTVIEGPKEEVVKIGTVVVFSCSARHQFSKSDEMQPVVWLKDGHPIDKFETARGGVNVLTDWQLTSVSSKLTLITASSSDNGVYSCTVPGSGTDKVTLFIDEAEAQATTQNAAGNSRWINAVPQLLILCTLLISAHLMHL